MLLGGCSPDEQELRQQRLEEAVAATLADPVAFNLSVGATDEALAAFGEAAGPLAALLAGSSAAGVIEEDRVALGLSIGGVDVVQVRVTAPGEQYVRFNLGALATDGTGGVDSQLEEALAEAALEPDAREAVLASARGEWVRLATAAADGPSAGASLGEALEALLLAAVPVGHTGSLDGAPFDGRLDVEVDVARALAAAAQALAGVVPSPLPTTAPADTDHLDGRVLVADGIVRTVVLELGPLAEGAAGVAREGAEGVAREGAEGVAREGAGGVELVLDLRQLPTTGLVTAPDVTATVTPDQLQRAAAALGDLVPATEP